VGQEHGRKTLEALSGCMEVCDSHYISERSYDIATPDRESLASGLMSIGDDVVSRSNDALLDDYFTGDYELHSPAGDLNRDEIEVFFAALRESFTDFTINRTQVLVDGNLVTSRTVRAARFDKQFGHIGIGTVQPERPTGEMGVDQHLPLQRRRPPRRGVVQADTYDFLRQFGIQFSFDSAKNRCSSSATTSGLPSLAALRWSSPSSVFRRTLGNSRSSASRDVLTNNGLLLPPSNKTSAPTDL
jgi:hypothetical protein